MVEWYLISFWVSMVSTSVMDDIEVSIHQRLAQSMSDVENTQLHLTRSIERLNSVNLLEDHEARKWSEDFSTRGYSDMSQNHEKSDSIRYAYGSSSVYAKSSSANENSPKFAAEAEGYSSQGQCRKTILQTKDSISASAECG